MPSRAWPIWLYTFLLIVGYPLLNSLYTMLVSYSGIPAAEGDVEDTFQSISDTLLVAPAVIGALWFCTRRYNPETRLLAWSDDERLVRSILATLLSGALFLFLLALIAAWISLEWRWYNLVWIIYILLWLPWPLSLRAALIEQGGEILHEPKVSSGFALVLATISYAGVGLAFYYFAMSLLAIVLGTAVPADNVALWLSAAILLVLGTAAYFAFRRVRQPRRWRLLLIALASVPAWVLMAFLWQT